MIDPTLPTTAVLRDAIRVIESSRLSIAVILDEAGRVVGTVSDGDVRRALLAGAQLDVPAKDVANLRPLTATADLPDAYLQKLLMASGLEAMPVVDVNGKFDRLVHLSHVATRDVVRDVNIFRAAVIMAGGEGQRLRPLTAAKPKPMIDVGGAPLLERQVASLRRSGITEIYVAINYLGHMIEDHFGDGSAFGVRISYLREQKKMGTAGALSLLPEGIVGDLLVMNGDILTRSDFGRLVAFHREQKANVTIAATQYDVSVPFGVIDTDGGNVTSLREKPSQRFLCNAGIYALSTTMLELLPRDSAVDMPELIALAIRQGRKVVAFPIYEFWSDIGTVRDLEFARRNADPVRK